MRAAFVVLLLSLTACEPEPVGDGRNDAGAALSCDNVSLEHFTGLSANHLSSCSDTGCGTENPPVGGNHCGTLVSCKLYTTEQPRCSWVHNLEHGHLALLYNCPSGCADEVAKLETLRGEAKKGANNVPRALVTPDGAMPRKFAAVAWGWRWTSDTFDENAVRCLMAKQDVDAPESNLACAP